MVLFLFSVTDKAFAQSVLTIDPAFQEVVLTGDTAEVDASITYRNDSEEIQELELFAYDFTQTDLIGSVGFVPSNQAYPHTLASFLELEQNKVILNPAEKKTVTVRIRNRTSLTPGGHYAAVVARLVQPTAKAETQQVFPAVSALILVRKTGGERFHLSLADTDWKPGALMFSMPEKIELLFRNDGNVHDIPRGQVLATNLFGWVLEEGIINESSFYVLPGTQRKIPVRLSARHWRLPIEIVTVTVKGSGQLSEIAFQSEESFVLVSWKFLLGVMIVVICFVVGKVWLRRRRLK